MSIRSAIDIGSNSVKLLVLCIGEGRAYEILWDEERVTGLGSAVSSTGKLSSSAIRDTLQVLQDYARIAEGLGSQIIRAAATSAVRDSSNSAELIDPAREMGIEIKVLSGADEARLSRSAALSELPSGSNSTQPIVFFDVGGGSTELTLYREGQALSECSLQLGARRLADMAHSTQPVDETARAEMRRIVRETYAAEAPVVEQVEPVQLLGLGGTASSIVWIIRGLRGEVKGDPHLAVVTAEELAMLLKRVSDLPLEHVKALPHLNPKRADTIYAGIMIIDELLRHYGVSEFTLVDRGLRFGLLLAEG